MAQAPTQSLQLLLTEAREPLALFLALRERARATEPLDATAATLCTVGLDGVPSARVVLVKEVDRGDSAHEGFVFYTNRNSNKGAELAKHPFAALVFHYPTLGVQVRARGTVVQTSEGRSDAYFASRPRESQLGAWASEQSRPITGLHEVHDRYADFERRYADQIVPRPPHWGGYLVMPQSVEIWLDGQHRLHERVLFERKDAVWTKTRLAP